ncbi:hypothetical protein [Glaciimonas soli]|uniref:Uncharacterized protein n=1 Tax=Glaciimonas soli TaxID=2590999 RepID=A0A843YND1_9BURK|nr:hypothetical protein [Glaciimonas soli]MQR00975.1 hypothetical protein [Glaciimonas soli]
MQPEYIARLPLDIRTLVEEIERASRVKITVEVDSARARNIPSQPDTMACEFSPHGAKLLIPTSDYFPDGSVLHELLHVRRFLVEGIPCLVDCLTYQHWRLYFAAGLIRLDNSIEHLIIVPEELRIRPNRREYWERVMMRLWDELALDRLTELARRELALINWAFIEHVLPGSAVQSYARVVLAKFDLTDRAQRCCDELIPSLQDKESAIRVCFSHLELPLEVASLEYIDTHAGTRREVPLG